MKKVFQTYTNTNDLILFEGKSFSSGWLWEKKTMKSKMVMIFLLLIPSLWASPSLFFTKEEINLIHAVDKKTENSSETIDLSAIVYMNQDHWSLWLNNRLIRSHQSLDIKGLHIEKVTPHNVTFSWCSPTSSVPLTFTLRQNQIFLVNEKRVLSK